MEKQRRRAGAVAAILIIFMAAAAVLLLDGCAVITTRATGDLATYESVEQTGVLVEGVPTLTVRVPNGSVHVVPGEEGRIGAVVRRIGKGEDEQAARASHDNLRVAFSQRGDQVTLDASRRWELGRNQEDEVSLEVSVPAGTRLDIKVTNGQANVGPVGGAVAVRVENGQIAVTPPAGDAFTFEARVVNGTITSGYGAIRVGERQDRVDATVGEAPAYTIETRVTNGQIFVGPAE